MYNWTSMKPMCGRQHQEQQGVVRGETKCVTLGQFVRIILIVIIRPTKYIWTNGCVCIRSIDWVSNLTSNCKFL